MGVDHLVHPHLEPRPPPLAALYLGRQPPAEVEVSSLEPDPTLQLRALGSALPQNQVLPQDLDRLQPSELLRHLEQLPLLGEQPSELKHPHLEQELLQHLAQPLEQALLTLLRLL